MLSMLSPVVREAKHVEGDSSDTYGLGLSHDTVQMTPSLLEAFHTLSSAKRALTQQLVPGRAFDSQSFALGLTSGFHL